MIFEGWETGELKSFITANAFDVFISFHKKVICHNIMFGIDTGNNGDYGQWTFEVSYFDENKTILYSNRYHVKYGYVTMIPSTIKGYRLDTKEDIICNYAMVKILTKVQSSDGIKEFPIVINRIDYYSIEELSGKCSFSTDLTKYIGKLPQDFSWLRGEKRSDFKFTRIISQDREYCFDKYTVNGIQYYEGLLDELEESGTHVFNIIAKSRKKNHIEFLQIPKVIPMQSIRKSVPIFTDNTYSGYVSGARSNDYNSFKAAPSQPGIAGNHTINVSYSATGWINPAIYFVLDEPLDLSDLESLRIIANTSDHIRTNIELWDRDCSFNYGSGNAYRYAFSSGYVDLDYIRSFMKQIKAIGICRNGTYYVSFTVRSLYIEAYKKCQTLHSQDTQT